MKKTITPLVLTLSITVLASPVFAHLSTDKTVVKNDGSDQITATANFENVVSGDLYIATLVNGELYTFADEGRKFSKDLGPFIANGNFSGQLKVVDLSAQGIPPAKYPLYKVVVLPGADPIDSNNWVGGDAGLAAIEFEVMEGTNEQDQVMIGKNKYISSGCSDSTCHSDNPGQNKNNIITGQESSKIRDAINEVSEMRTLGTLDNLTETDLDDISAYLRTF